MSWDENLTIDGSRLDADITTLVRTATLTRTMEGAESLDLQIFDEDMDFLVAGVLTRRGKASTVAQQLQQAAWERYGRSALSLDGVFFRFAGVSFNYAIPPWTVTLTFEAELATLMRQQTKAVKSSRGKQTRLAFIRRLANTAQIGALSDRGVNTFGIFMPDVDHRDPVAKAQPATRQKGISPHAHLTIDGVQIDAEQRRNITIALTEAEDQNASERVMLAELCAGMAESGFRAIPNGSGSDYGGVFQGKFKGTNPQFKIDDTKGMAHSFLAGGKGYQGGGAIKLAASNAAMTPGEIALRVEGSLANFHGDTQRAIAFYQNFATEAANVLAAWGGADRTVSVNESFEFKAGGPKSGGGHNNYWADSGTLADVRRWRRFATANTLYVGPDEWFFRNQPAFVINGSPPDGMSRKHWLSQQGFLGLTGDADVGMPTSEVTVSLLAPRWTTSPGTTFEFAALGPLTGRWLIWKSVQDITQTVERADVTLRAPQPERKEPAPTTRARTESTPGTGSPRDLIVAAAKKALKYVPQYVYEQSRPFPDHLIPLGPEILHMDCPAFATLVYKTAGVPDPNGPAYAYNGSGNTGSLMAHGTRTASPQPGDLLFFRSPEHVAVYIGGGKCIEMGGTPGPREEPVTYRSDRIGYYTYDLTAV